MAKHSYKEQERQRREQEILEKAGELLKERGYAELNVDEVDDSVGISKPTMYQHFKSKEELVGKVIGGGIDKMRSEIEKTLQGTPLQKLELILRGNLKTFYSTSGVWSALDPSVWMALRANTELARFRADAVTGLESLIEEAKAVGEIPQDIPTFVVLRAMFYLQGIFRAPFKHVNRNESTVPADQVQDTIDAVVRIFLHVISQPSEQQAAHQPEQHLIRTSPRAISE